ncbi:hypothetical protein SEA_DRE3_57 [Gordonia phage Dre3]|uniref:Uncharacterized protein n=1 Tax=Gordonia phage Gibbous TaxID=2652405 RepID=A0A5J6T4H3_9CAUD|nr:hypothetical protein QLQ74_gp57 [Gordonia phage Gibbous]QFG05133.1 hypothetical protein SEA_GIBBOUS_57 [Gordonia phage Gibbous]QRI45986.1 hypothetical protein SEA_DRE3_57 [Gordonia phage Dre3]
MKKKEVFSQVYDQRPTAAQMSIFLGQVPNGALIYIHGFANGGGGKVEAILETEQDDV